MKKVVINSCYGGFGLSKLARDRYAELCGYKLFHYVTDYESKDFNRQRLVIEDNRHDCLYSVKQYLGDYTTHDILNKAEWFRESDISRHDPNLVRVVEELGEKANDAGSNLAIVEIPDDVEYVIEEYDGYEHVAEKHRTWG